MNKPRQKRGPDEPIQLKNKAEKLINKLKKPRKLFYAQIAWGLILLSKPLDL